MEFEPAHSLVRHCLFASRFCCCLRGQDTASLPRVSAAFVAKTLPLCLAFLLPSWPRHCLCLAFRSHDCCADAPVFRLVGGAGRSESRQAMQEGSPPGHRKQVRTAGRPLLGRSVRATRPPPPRQPPPPVVAPGSHCATGIAYSTQGVSSQTGSNITSSPEADPRTLIKYVSPQEIPMPTTHCRSKATSAACFPRSVATAWASARTSVRTTLRRVTRTQCERSTPKHGPKHRCRRRRGKTCRASRHTQPRWCMVVVVHIAA